MKLPYGNDLNYWKTSNSPAQAWIEKVADLIEKHGGTVQLSAKGRHLDQVGETWRSC